MPQDAFTLNYLCLELNKTFSKGKINRIIQPNKDTVIFTVYTGKKTEKLLLDVNPGCPRIGVTDKEYESPLTAPNFCMLLRKYLLSATIEHISLVGFDRIVKIELSPSNEFFDCENKALYVELMGRYSNIILTENGKVLGGNRGVNFFDNGVRPLIVGRDYTLPPKGGKKEPWDSELIEIFNQNNQQSISLLITTYVQGFAKSTADEIEKEFLESLSIKKQGDVDNFGKDLFNFINKFISEKKINPCVYKVDNKVSSVCAFEYALEEGEIVRFDKLFLAEEYYFDSKQKDKCIKDLFTRLSSVISTAERKIKKKLFAISSREKEAEKAEQNRLFGELILANLYKIKQGQDSILVDNYYDQTTVKISLDKNLSPSKNAENYYKKYNKQKRAIQMLSIQREQAEKELSYVNSVKEELDLFESLEDLYCIKEELILQGILKEQSNIKKKKVVGDKFRRYVIDGFTVKVGRNNVENDEITLSASGNDIWVHSKEYHSSHAVIESNGREIPLEVIEKTASIVAYYSKARFGGKTEIVYTKRKFVKKLKKANAGFFIYTVYNSIAVLPEKGEKYLK